jgi:plastocyanin
MAIWKEHVGSRSSTVRNAVERGAVRKFAESIGDPNPLSDPELRQELGISDAAAIHRIRVTGSGDRTRLLPLRTQIRPGDVVQFVILDHRTHLVRFLDDETASDALEFLRHTGQDRPPPLVARESRLVLSFRDAPPGRYPFRVESTGSPVEGEIRVLGH